MALRIAYIGQKGIPAKWGGVEAAVEACAVRLAARGHSVAVYVRRWYSDPASPMYRGVQLIRTPTIHTKHLDAGLHSFTSALDALSRGFDIVHFQAIGPCLFSWLPRLRGARVVASVQALDYQWDKWGRMAKAALRLGEWCAFRFPHETLAVSQSLLTHYRDQGRQTRLVTNGIDDPTPAPADEIGSRFGLKGGDYILFLARWEPNKGVDKLIRSYLRLHDPTLKLVVAGDAPQRNAYREQVQRAADGHPGVIFPGMVSGRLKAELLTNAAGYVTASDNEGLPISLLEAMSYGVPVAASDIPAHREVLAPIDQSALFPLGDGGALTSALRVIESRPADSRRQLGARLAGHALGQYGWDRIVDRLEQLYNELIDRGRQDS